eukprot:Em0015g144a
MEPEGAFLGQYAIVTGGAQGLGEGIVKMLVDGGCSVMIFDVNLAKTKAFASSLSEKGHVVECCAVNVAEEASVTAGFEAFRETFPRLDIMVNCAGIVGPNGVKIESVSAEDFDRVYAVNTKGSFLMTKYSIIEMKKNNYGRILLIASVAGKEGNAGMCAYSMSKAAVIGLVKSVGKEYAETGITVNALAPAVTAANLVGDIQCIVIGRKSNVGLLLAVRSIDITRDITFTSSSLKDVLVTNLPAGAFFSFGAMCWKRNVNIQQRTEPDVKYVSHLPLARFTSVVTAVAALDSLLCISLWLAGGDNAYLETSVEGFSITRSTFDLACLAAIRGVLLLCFLYLLEHYTLASVSGQPGSQQVSSRRHAFLCHVALLILASGSFIYGIVKGSIIVRDIVRDQWTGVHITYKIVVICGVVFPAVETVLGLCMFYYAKRLKRRYRLRLLVTDEATKERKSKKNPSITRLALLAKPEYPMLTVGTVALVISSALFSIAPYFFGKVVEYSLPDLTNCSANVPNNTICSPLGMGPMNDQLLILLVIFVLASITSFIRAIFFDTAGERFVARLRRILFEAISRQEIAFFDTNRTGELLNRLASDTQVIQSAVTTNFSMLLRYLLQMVISLCVMFYINAKLTAVLVSVFPVVVVYHRELNPGTLTSLMIYTINLAMSFALLSNLYGEFAQALGASVRIFDILDRHSEVIDGNLEPLGFEGGIIFDKVQFRYPSRPEELVLKGISFKVQPGEVVALVGASGGGKSTIVNLIEHFYEIDSGHILLGPHQLKDLKPSWFRRHIALVSQEPVLFAGTVADNIRFGREEATMKEVEDAAKQANADDFVTKFEKRYDTVVGERGIRLSGGQKQRIAIARALITNPDILLLDEATSALDAESEHLVQEAVDRAMAGRTVLVIAHRLSTVRNASQVIVIDKGQIVEQGTHEELISLNGVYRRLVLRQLQAGKGDDIL